MFCSKCKNKMVYCEPAKTDARKANNHNELPFWLCKACGQEKENNGIGKPERNV